MIITAVPSFFTVSITWSPPAVPNGVIITMSYEVSYRPVDSSLPVIRFNTTDLATSFTTQRDLDLGTEFIISVTAHTQVSPGNITIASVSTPNRPCKV